jgi:hypothetical protein
MYKSKESEVLKNKEKKRMTTVTVISKARYEAEYNDKVGSLLFPSDWYDCLHYVDTTKLRKNIKNQLPSGATILRVLIPVDTSSRYKNIANRKIPYKTALCADRTQEGAYYKEYPEMNFAMWASDFPVGDAVVVINVEEEVEVKSKEEVKKETTRKANKAKNQKEKERLEFEARVAEANKVLAEQEKHKRMLKAKKTVAKKVAVESIA